MLERERVCKEGKRLKKKRASIEMHRKKEKNKKECNRVSEKMCRAIEC